jgi:hypothetical protein
MEEGLEKKPRKGLSPEQRRIRELERELLTTVKWQGGRVRMTIAEMILAGPPKR